MNTRVFAATALLSCVAADVSAQTVSATFALDNATGTPVEVSIGDEPSVTVEPGARLVRTYAFIATPGAYHAVRAVAAWAAGRCEAMLRLRPAPEPLIPPDCIGAGSSRQGKVACTWKSRPDRAACAISLDVRPE